MYQFKENNDKKHSKKKIKHYDGMLHKNTLKSKRTRKSEIGRIITISQDTGGTPPKQGDKNDK